ncbi:MAG: acyl-CoA dehydrogenase [Sphingomonadales bacterium]|nr:acyl-CoA dehydrogenase [Sphingomonadales bacterium]
MNFEIDDNHRAIIDGVAKVCAPFDDDYWTEREETKSYPYAFHKAMADGGWLGITMPVELGGAGLGVTEAALMMHTVASSSGTYSAASTIHLNLFGPHAIVVHGSPEQKQQWLPPLIRGEHRACFGVTEPDAGLDTTSMTTFASKVDGGYRVNGRKIWTSSAQVADKVLLIARTTHKQDCKRPTDGISLFYTDLDRTRAEVRRIPKMGRNAVDSNTVFYDDYWIPEGDLIGEEGRGFYYLLDSINPERVLVGIEATAIGQNALRRATEYARDRVVFGRPIGKNQGIQHPLAQNWIELQTAYWACLRAAWLYDQGKSCGAECNMAKYLGGKHGHEATIRAVMVHGGMGYATEYQVERLYRESILARISPVTEELMLSFIAERVLGLPKSY